MKIRKIKKEYSKYVFPKLDEIEELKHAVKNLHISKKKKSPKFLIQLHKEDLKEASDFIQQEILEGKHLIKSIYENRSNFSKISAHS